MKNWEYFFDKKNKWKTHKKFVLPKINHLKGIKIERIGYSNEPLPKLSKEEEHNKIVSYQQALLEKINNKEII